MPFEGNEWFGWQKDRQGGNEQCRREIPCSASERQQAPQPQDEYGNAEETLQHEQAVVEGGRRTEYEPEHHCSGWRRRFEVGHPRGQGGQEKQMLHIVVVDAPYRV